jgi:hypothetical protein
VWGERGCVMVGTVYFEWEDGNGGWAMARLVFCSGDWGIRKRLEWWCQAVRVE